MAQDEASAHDHLVCAWGQDRRQGWALDREDRKTLGELLPWRGSFTRVPGGAGPPVKPLALALRHPGSGGLTGSVRATQYRVNPSATRDKEGTGPRLLWAPVRVSEKCS